MKMFLLIKIFNFNLISSCNFTFKALRQILFTSEFIWVRTVNCEGVETSRLEHKHQDVCRLYVVR